MHIDIDAKALGLTRGEARLLTRLVEGAPRAVTRGALLDAVYSGRTRPRTDRLCAIVSGLRRKLRERGVTIETRRGVGYRLSRPMCERLAEREWRDRRDAPITPTSAPPPKLPTSLMQGGVLRLRERLAEAARRYGLGAAMAALRGRTSVAGAIEFHRRADGSFGIER